MKILGIDPGYRSCGFAIAKLVGKKKIEYIDSGVIKGHLIEDFYERMAFYFSEAQRLVRDYSPDHIALESLIYVKSPTALIKLAHSRGAMIAGFAMEHKHNIYEYSPNEVKLFASGHGHSGKGGVQYIVGQITGKKDFLTHDESDALAVVLCHIMHNPLSKEKFQIGKKGKGKKGSSLKNSLSHLL